MGEVGAAVGTVGAAAENAKPTIANLASIPAASVSTEANTDTGMSKFQGAKAKAVALSNAADQASAANVTAAPALTDDNNDSTSKGTPKLLLTIILVLLLGLCCCCVVCAAVCKKNEQHPDGEEAKRNVSSPVHNPVWGEGTAEALYGVPPDRKSDDRLHGVLLPKLDGNAMLDLDLDSVDANGDVVLEHSIALNPTYVVTEPRGDGPDVDGHGIMLNETYDAMLPGDSQLRRGQANEHGEGGGGDDIYGQHLGGANATQSPATESHAYMELEKESDQAGPLQLQKLRAKARAIGSQPAYLDQMPGEGVYHLDAPALGPGQDDDDVAEIAL